MHGLVNRAVQCFVRDTYGPDVWDQLVQTSGAPVDGFEVMSVYDDTITESIFASAEYLLGRRRDTILEDIGTYLVINTNAEAVRRLLRFGGQTFCDFLASVDDIPRRAHIAVPELVLPSLEVLEGPAESCMILCREAEACFVHVVTGVLRAMADDYGALAVLEHIGRRGDGEWILVQVTSAAHSEGRPFRLAAGREAP